MLFIKLFSRLPMPLLYLMADMIFVLVYYFIGYRKKVVRDNITRSFPEMKSREVRQTTREFYRRFTEYIVETLKGITIDEKDLLKRVKFINIPEVQPYADANQSIIVIASHQFNWEWALQVGCLVLPFPVDAVYQKLSNEKFDQVMVNTRGRFGGRPIEKSKVLREIIKTKDRLRALGIVADQSPRPSSPKYWTKFLNQDTAFFMGPEQIAKVANYPAYFFKVIRVKRGYYTVELVKLGEPPYDIEEHQILENYARETEQLIKSDPPGYMWSHRRWKLKKEQDIS